MKIKFLTLLFTMFALFSGAFAQTSWLDRPFSDWNRSGTIPQAPRATGNNPDSSMCRNTVRNPESIADRAVTRAGWSLFGAAQTYGAVTLVNGMASVDGMCRPNQFNTFIFVRNRFAGTLSPVPMNSRTDGALTEAMLVSPTDITAEFARYTSFDALCCPSQTSTVNYRVSGSRVLPENVSTNAVCQNQGEFPATANQVTGTVTYRERISLPQNAILNIKLEDVTNSNAPPKVVAEKRINLNGRQVPISFELDFGSNRVDSRNDYVVDAEIWSGSRILFTNESRVPVLTKGNPSRVEVVVVPTGNQDQSNQNVLRGTVSYRERMALPRDAEIKVKLIDATQGTLLGAVISEDNFRANGRQVPFQYELRYSPRQIRSNNNYIVQAEIYTDGKLAFKTDREYPVLTRGNPTTNVSLVLVRATGDDDPATVTGKEISISKFGAGSLDIDGRSDKLIVRVQVKVDKDGKARVTLSPIGAAITFSGNLISDDNSTLKIVVTSSGSADASGEIEVKYSGNRLSSVVSRNLVLDGQKASISF